MKNTCWSKLSYVQEKALELKSRALTACLIVLAATFLVILYAEALPTEPAFKLLGVWTCLEV